MPIDPLYLVFSFIIGTAIGSFLNVVILRLPTPDASIVFPASHCPVCKSPLKWYENIPILSFLFLKGKCGHCKTPLSLQYPVVEFLTGMIGMAVTATYGWNPSTAVLFLFCCALICIIWIDIHHQIIPDVISLPGIVVGFAFSFFSPIVNWQESLFGILIGGGIFYAISLSYLLIRKQEGLGGGDIKLLAMLGAFLGWQSLFFIIFASSVSGTIAGLAAMQKQKKGGATRIPFGPFLVLSGLLYLFFKPQILDLFSLYINAFS